MRGISVFILIASAVFGQGPGGAGRGAVPANLSPGQIGVRQLFQRNIGTAADQDTAFEAHKIIGNVYYVGTRSLASFLITTPEGHILINSDYERTVPVLKAQVEKLGFQFSDVKILLGSHAHGDHMEGDAMVKELTGAKVMAMAEDLPALERIMPGGKKHPVDRVLHDGDTVELGGMKLTALLTPGHTKGCTTWTFTAKEGGAGGKDYKVVIVGSVGVNPGFVLVNNAQNPGIADEYRRAYLVLRGLKPDVPLASHPAMYGMAEKFALIGKGANPFIDPAGYVKELDLTEGVFKTIIAEQTAAAAQPK